MICVAFVTVSVEVVEAVSGCEGLKVCERESFELGKREEDAGMMKERERRIAQGDSTLNTK